MGSLLQESLPREENRGDPEDQPQSFLVYLGLEGRLSPHRPERPHSGNQPVEQERLDWQSQYLCSYVKTQRPKQPEEKSLFHLTLTGNSSSSQDKRERKLKQEERQEPWTSAAYGFLSCLLLGSSATSCYISSTRLGMVPLAGAWALPHLPAIKTKLARHFHKAVWSM